jgi:hypothetical protein
VSRWYKIQAVNLEEINQRAVTLLSGIVYGPPELIATMVRPSHEDFAAVFLGDAAKQAEDAYAEFWANPPGALTKTVGVKVHVVTKLSQDIVESGQFPGGYARIAQLLAPDQAWSRFKLIGDGGREVMGYDGLVARGDRFVWFPKPWRAFKVAAPDEN